MPQCACQVTFANTRRSYGNDIAGFLHKGSAAQPLDVEPQRHSKPLELQSAKGLFPRQPRLLEPAFQSTTLALFALQSRQFIQKRFMREAFFGRFESDL